MGLRERNQQSIPKMNAFKVSYLIGVSDSVLRKNFEEDYIETGYTEKLKAVKDAEYLRALCKVRQILFKYYQQYNVSSGNYSTEVRNVTGSYLSDFISILSENNFNLYRHIDENHVCGTLNELSKQIGNIVYRVLDDLNILHKEYVGTLFKYPDFDRKNIIAYCNKMKSKDNYPHGVIIFNTSKIEEHMGYMLFNDRNMYISCYKLKNVYYDYENDAELWNYSDIKNGSVRSLSYESSSEKDTNTSSLNEDALKVLSSVVNSVTNENEVEADENNNTIVSSKENTKQTTVNHSLDNLLKSAYKLTHVYVDCDNIEYFKFLALIEELGKAEVEFVIKLFKDVKSNDFWNTIPIRKDNVKIVTIDVDRIIGLKSMVDTAMTTTICKDVYQNGVSSLYIVSSDSDFLGLIKNVEIKDLGVIYNANKMNVDYLTFLEEREDVLIADLDKLNTNKVSTIYRDYSIKLLFLKHMHSIPLNSWTHTDCVNFILQALNNACIGEINVDDISSTVNTLKENVKINFGENGFEISIEGMTLDETDK